MHTESGPLWAFILAMRVLAHSATRARVTAYSGLQWSFGDTGRGANRRKGLPVRGLRERRDTPMRTVCKPQVFNELAEGLGVTD